jgi:hypothetical protein
MKERKEEKFLHNFLIKWSFKTRENFLIKFKDFLYEFYKRMITYI